ncbi:MerR family transcriptional regulator [Salidesulfovibrio onnuriiensis]|uniref:MerR family transcriptional regulator n=1 Tax=Salidesulfovibrio onnuriiensis TaxID=2583823 RepID=UPI0011CAE2EF|nr:MerR family transcriptional regulator [Salidesulfovibrio onnuriiensis]
MSETYTHKDLARLCGVSETTIKSYRRKFPTFIPVHTDGKPIRFKKEMGDVCLKIRECFEQGMSINETYKLLKGQFQEHRRKDAPKASAGAGTPAPGVSKEYLEKFFETAGQMMHGMAQLATAQARADKRLEKVEKALEALITAEDRSDEVYSALLEHLKGAPAESSKPRKVVNVRGREGTKTYTIEESAKPASEPESDPEPVREPVAPAQEPDPAPEQKPEAEDLPKPSETFMETPIVIRNEQGEFLGVPGRIALRGFIEAVVEQGKETGAILSNWERRDRSWAFVMKNAEGRTHELFFGGTKTPRGNLVVLFWRLDVDGEETAPEALQEFFRQVKDRLVG